MSLSTTRERCDKWKLTMCADLAFELEVTFVGYDNNGEVVFVLDSKDLLVKRRAARDLSMSARLLLVRMEVDVRTEERELAFLRTNSWR